MRSDNNLMTIPKALEALEILGIAVDTLQDKSLEEMQKIINKAYKKQALGTHPDKKLGEKEKQAGESKFKTVANANDLLMQDKNLRILENLVSQSKPQPQPQPKPATNTPSTSDLTFKNWTDFSLRIKKKWDTFSVDDKINMLLHLLTIKTSTQSILEVVLDDSVKEALCFNQKYVSQLKAKLKEFNPKELFYSKVNHIQEILQKIFFDCYIFYKNKKAQNKKEYLSTLFDNNFDSNFLERGSFLQNPSSELLFAMFGYFSVVGLIDPQLKILNYVINHKTAGENILDLMSQIDRNFFQTIPNMSGKFPVTKITNPHQTLFFVSYYRKNLTNPDFTNLVAHLYLEAIISDENQTTLKEACSKYQDQKDFNDIVIKVIDCLHDNRLSLSSKKACFYSFLTLNSFLKGPTEHKISHLFFIDLIQLQDLSLLSQVSTLTQYSKVLKDLDILNHLCSVAFKIRWDDGLFCLLKSVSAENALSALETLRFFLSQENYLRWKKALIESNQNHAVSASDSMQTPLSETIYVKNLSQIKERLKSDSAFIDAKLLHLAFTKDYYVFDELVRATPDKKLLEPLQEDVIHLFQKSPLKNPHKKSKILLAILVLNSGINSFENEWPADHLLEHQNTLLFLIELGIKLSPATLINFNKAYEQGVKQGKVYTNFLFNIINQYMTSFHAKSKEIDGEKPEQELLLAVYKNDLQLVQRIISEKNLQLTDENFINELMAIVITNKSWLICQCLLKAANKEFLTGKNGMLLVIGIINNFMEAKYAEDKQIFLYVIRSFICLGLKEHFENFMLHSILFNSSQKSSTFIDSYSVLIDFLRSEKILIDKCLDTLIKTFQSSSVGESFQHLKKQSNNAYQRFTQELIGEIEALPFNVAQSFQNTSRMFQSPTMPKQNQPFVSQPGFTPTQFQPNFMRNEQKATYPVQFSQKRKPENPPPINQTDKKPKMSTG